MPRFRSFREALVSARNSKQVAQALSQAMGTLTPEELRALPDECRDALVDRKADVHTVAVTFLHCDLRHRGERDIGELIRQIAEVYAWASVRLSQLEHTNNGTS